VNKFQHLAIILILVLGILLIFISLSAPGQEIFELNNEALSGFERVFIDYVYDGDTVRTARGEKIRLIGLDTPEMNWEEGEAEFYAREAFEYTREKLLKRSVYLEYDKEHRDKYDRLLAYLFLEDGTFFNQELLKEAYAGLLLIPPNLKYQDLFKETVREARLDYRGIWKRWEILKTQLPEISWEEADQYTGCEVIVKGRIENTSNLARLIILNYTTGKEAFHLVIFKDALIRFDYKPVELAGKELMVAGIIEEYRGLPQIIIENPLQILYPLPD
jgi:micrococcal nuclease